MVSREACREKYGVLLEDIMRFLCQDKHPNLILHDNGLLYTYGTNRAVTWMNSTVNGHPVIPRTGYIVEINTFGITLCGLQENCRVRPEIMLWLNHWDFGREKREVVCQCVLE